ncbi:hypothetical protein H6F93_01830 [Leptolyngbya sp. FACHB-671]|uniref:hypothetical protein n=1 Tax=Leptolyngbya sp. FACHB-671 TaxID=2692812 RepID=UPI0016876E82|nr:hypothetical protein [Leptolyngbya sp. FACHB-671]MBD2066279.1 hypothetical protein [Leptolyngbya sp. FACHB-671]
MATCLCSGKAKEIEPFAVLEALDIVSAEDARNQVVYRSDNSDVVVQFRKTKPKDDEHHELQSFRELIEIEQEKAKRTNAQPIAEVEKAIELLQQMLAVLTQTDKGRKLQDEYDALVVQLTEYKPILAVKLK